ncbi:MAG: ATP-binding protein [Longicatena sp.]
MERTIMQKLLTWKTSTYRKPLILKGVRQCGKTWILNEFGKLYYDNVAYINFDEHKEYCQFFTTTKDTKRILQNLEMAIGVKIEPFNTLLIFDEIQECAEALNSLKYFCENANNYHIVAAGSLLGISLAKPSGFPVGKVDFLEMKPMTFTEFLLANNDHNLIDYLEQLDYIEPLAEAFFNPLIEKLKMYFITGGMPEAIHMWTCEHSVPLVENVLANILDAYERDFMKHAEIKDFPKLSLIWKSIPSQLAKENKKFLYKVVKNGARAREYENALQWLVDANLAYKVYRSSACGIPLSAYDDLNAFKIYLLDVGLLRKLSHLDPSAFSNNNQLFVEFKGSLTENFVLQSLQNQSSIPLRYWAIDNPNYEVDFVMQRKNDILPIEVKASTNLKSKSLQKYKNLYSDKTKLRIRFSLDNLKLDDDILNIPLPLIDYSEKLISLAYKILEKTDQ